ncbi:unnamed protein product, partial [Amoebophrya sp. A25]
VPWSSLVDISFAHAVTELRDTVLPRAFAVQAATAYNVKSAARHMQHATGDAKAA